MASKKMVVDIVGEQDGDAPTIVLLPGLGSPSSVLEFKPWQKNWPGNIE